MQSLPFVVKVSVIPPASDLDANAMFENRRRGEAAHSPNVHWLDVYAVLHKKALERNIVLATDDMLPCWEADIVLCMLQPKSPHEFLRLKQKNPRLKTIMVLLETSLGAEYARLNPRNHRQFDAVLTYDDRLIDNKRYFPMRTRAYLRDRITRGLPFCDRRVGCLVGTNRRVRFRSGMIAMRRGWHFSLRDWYDYAFVPGELITYRSTVGRLCAQYPVGTFDIFGEGWDIHEETRDRCLGVPRTSTLSYVGNYKYYFAFENHESERSIISERIWDALWGDAVPVYRGNKNVNRTVPKECYIDANEFQSPNEMLDWLVCSSESEWGTYREARGSFIRSVAVEKFLPEACAKEMLIPIVALAEEVRALRARQ